MSGRVEWMVRPSLFRVQYALWRLRGRAGLVPHVHKEAIIREHARRHGLRVLVETGTYKGDMVEALRGEFEEIHTIELDPVLYRDAAARFAGAPHIVVHKGDSTEILPVVLKRLRGPALFWLDGHFSGEFTGVMTARATTDTPVRAEVKAIFGQDARPHVVLIDDARLFTGAGDYPSLAELEMVVRAYRPQVTVTAQDDVIRISSG